MIDVARQYEGFTAIFHDKPNQRVAEHAHRGLFELFLPLEGSIDLLQGKQSFTCPVGSALFVPEGSKHAFKAKGGKRLIALVDPSLFKDALGFATPEVTQAFQVKPLHIRMLSMLALGDDVTPIDLFVRAFLASLSPRLSEPETLPRRSMPVLAVSDYRLQRAQEVLSSSLQQTPSIQHIAKSVGASVRTLNRLFQDQLGTKPKQYLMAQRIELAKTLLASGCYSVEDVAEEVGLDSVSYFRRLFYKATGRRARRGLRI